MTNFDNRNEIDEVFRKYFIDKIEIDDTLSLPDDYSLTKSSSYFGIIPVLPLNEEDLAFRPESYVNDYPIYLITPSQDLFPRKKIFEVIYPKITQIFSKFEDDSSDSSTNDELLNKRKRYLTKRRRRENSDNIRKKIKRGFLNNALIKNINIILKNKGAIILFKKFQQKFVADITKKTNKILINLTLEEIFEKKELYHEDDYKFYFHNLKLVKSKEVQENKELKKILNKKYFELFEDYLNSKEFKIDEINRLKNNKMDDVYIKRYIYLAKNFIKFVRE